MNVFIFSVIIIYYSLVRMSQMFDHHLCQFSVWASFLSSQHDATRINCCWARALAGDIDRQLRVAGARSSISAALRALSSKPAARCCCCRPMRQTVTLNDLESLSLAAKLCKCNSTIICAAFRIVSTDTAHLWSPGDSWACTVSDALYIRQNEEDFHITALGWQVGSWQLKVFFVF